MKHVHHDLIVEWAKDTGKTVQIYINDMWVDCNKPAWSIDHRYRLKPREFVKGHWYPCVDYCGDKLVCIFNGESFSHDISTCSRIERVNSLLFIGESLGEIKFS